MTKFYGFLITLFILMFASQVQAQAVYYVDLYTDENFQGTKYRIPVYRDEQDLHDVLLRPDYELNDKTSSVEYNLPADWEVLLWEHPNFQGDYHVLRGKGSIAKFSAGVDIDKKLNDEISSVQWRSTRSDNVASLGTKKCSLVLFEDPNSRGSALTVNCNQNIKDLRTVRTDEGRDGFDNKVSSLIYNLPPGVRVQLFQHTDFKSPLLIELAGNGTITAIEKDKEDRISSVRWVGK